MEFTTNYSDLSTDNGLPDESRLTKGAFTRQATESGADAARIVAMAVVRCLPFW